jgi:hypothetical protein
MDGTWLKLVAITENQATQNLNWVCKFFIDSNLFESKIRAREIKKGGYHAAR